MTKLLLHTIVLTAILGTLSSHRSLAEDVPVNAESARLHAIFDAAWKQSLKDAPTRASRLGMHDYDDLWPDESLAAIEQRHQRDKAVLEQLDGINLSALTPGDRISYQLFRKERENRVAGHGFGGFLLPINQRGGAQDAGNLADSLRFEKSGDYESWLKRMASFPAHVDWTIELMREGVRRRIVHSKVVMKRVPRQVQAQIVDLLRDVQHGEKRFTKWLTQSSN